MLSQRVETFFGKLRATPNFGSEEELRAMGERYNDKHDLVQAVIDAKFAVKDDA